MLNKEICFACKDKFYRRNGGGSMDHALFKEIWEINRVYCHEGFVSGYVFIDKDPPPECKYTFEHLMAKEL